MNRKLFLFCLMLALAACQAATPSAPTPTLIPSPSQTPIPSLTPTPLPPTPSPFPDPFEGKAKVGNYDMQISCKGTGEPTIILENGSDYQSWISVHQQKFSSIARTCLYPRVGMTDLTANPTGPRTTLDQVKELHSLLQQTGVPGPYILVGHSVAGFNLVLYTGQYPDEVVGLVCVDCRYAAIDEIWLEKLKPVFEADPSLDEGEFKESYIDWFDKNSQPDYWKDIKERQDFGASVDQVLAISSLGNRPFVVLVASKKDEAGKYMDPRFAKAYDEAWQEVSITLSKLSTQGRVEYIAKGTTHLGAVYDPAVVKAIQEVYDIVKKK